MGRTAEQTGKARHCSPNCKRDEKRRASKVRRIDEKVAIRSDRDPKPRHTKGWAD